MLNARHSAAMGAPCHDSSSVKGPSPGIHAFSLLNLDDSQTGYIACIVRHPHLHLLHLSVFGGRGTSAALDGRVEGWTVFPWRG